METNNVRININIVDGDKTYKANWTFTERALEEYTNAGLTRERQITSLMIKMLQSELAIHLTESKEVPAENEVIATYLDPTYSFVDYSLDPEQQLPYQKRLREKLSFDASWMAPNMNNKNYRVFITGFRTLKMGQIDPLAFQGEFKTFEEVDEFYNQTVKELLKLIDVN